MRAILHKKLIKNVKKRREARKERKQTKKIDSIADCRVNKLFFSGYRQIKTMENGK